MTETGKLVQVLNKLQQIIHMSVRQHYGRNFVFQSTYYETFLRCLTTAVLSQLCYASYDGAAILWQLFFIPKSNCSVQKCSNLAFRIIIAVLIFTKLQTINDNYWHIEIWIINTFFTIFGQNSETPATVATTTFPDFGQSLRRASFLSISGKGLPKNILGNILIRFEKQQCT